MQHIETVPVGSGGAASITFSAIPDTFTDLLVVVSGRSTRATNNYYTNGKIGINGLTTGYSNRELFGYYNGSSVALSTTDLTDGVWSFKFPSAVTTANTFSNSAFYFPNYRSNAAKSVSMDYVSEHNAQQLFSWYTAISAGLNTTTSPITSIEIGMRAADSAIFAEHSSASLYGILAGSDGIVAVS